MTYTTLMATGPAAGGGGMMELFGMIAMMIAIMYLLVIRPQKKREKQVQQMRSSVEVGDSITTIGGIIGIVVKVSDDAFVIESSSDRTKLRILKGAVQTNNSANDAKVKTAQDAAEAKKKGKVASVEEAKDTKKEEANDTKEQATDSKKTEDKDAE